jgi:hypothetical protein
MGETAHEGSDSAESDEENLRLAREGYCENTPTVL